MRIAIGTLMVLLVTVASGCGDKITGPTSLSVSSLGPSSAQVGSSVDVRIHGTGFRVGAKVSVGVPAMNVVVMDSTLITATVPAQDAGALNVVVTNPNGESSTLAGALTFVKPFVELPKAVVTGTLEVSQSGADPDPVSYVFNLTLTEVAGVPATITALWIAFDGGWGGECIWTPDKLAQTRLPANGTLALGPFTCSDGGEAFDVDVSVHLTDDNAHKTGVSLFRTFVVRW